MGLATRHQEPETNDASRKGAKTQSFKPENRHQEPSPNCIGGAGGLFFGKAIEADRLTLPSPGIMAKRDKTYFKITFTNDAELYQVCARRVASSDLYGLIEIGDFIFPRNKLVYNPGEERIRREFEGIRRTWLPYHSIVRIDEVSDEREGEIKIVPLESFRRDSPREPLLKKPEGS